MDTGMSSIARVADELWTNKIVAFQRELGARRVAMR